jgi:hypothetical protein
MRVGIEVREEAVEMTVEVVEMTVEDVEIITVTITTITPKEVATRVIMDITGVASI